MSCFKKISIVVLIAVIFNCLRASNPSDYTAIRKNYENFKKNDKKALPYVNSYIKKAKKESNFPKLVQGYRDAVLFNSSAYQKLVYSDSMIYAALRSGDEDLISTAYLGKGIIYYSDFKRFKPALDEYVKAYQYSKDTNDKYLKHKVIYHLGMVKNYLGYYEEALTHFIECAGFFETKTKENLHTNELYNNTRGYFNSLHQLTICYGNTQQYVKADSIITLAFAKIDKSDKTHDFLIERSYFLKSRGILNLCLNNYEGATNDLNQALHNIIRVGDFEWASIIYYNLGRSHLKFDHDKAINYFQKVDSIFTKHRFVVPRIRNNYEFLINHYKEKKNIERQLYYTNQLLKADSLLSKDFTYLSLKIHREYDRQSLLDQKKGLEKSNFNRTMLASVLLLLIIILLIYYIFYFRKRREVKLKYLALLNTLNDDQRGIGVERNIPKSAAESNRKLTDTITLDLIEKFKIFEENKDFLKPGLTQNKLAVRMKTNTNYLSKFINQSKGMNFTRYIAELRIEYITKLLYTERKYLNYNIEAIAEEFGYANRQSFSDQFFEINGIRPIDFVKRRKAEIENDND
ncbi:AraC family transcriptional regulator [Kaistella flava (ex Peng et al. 2021)]|uniref:AraC family transcriptional regulator n=1 Tax=Kaistella flava (ex Peng et al. 2021) TaxID=2038776 RepID=A0A7M2Y928_9FLAO|nr:helix-turn-helix domain-containing protein [Kaistella flava (ex Peng et al. 2021)]QOW09912.1 AraC family transcriptional regulator [Kaistella flava (ex Peng et al. 2021)]